MANSALDAGFTGWASFVPPSRTGSWPWLPGVSWFWMLLALLGVFFVTSYWAVPHFERKLDASAHADLRDAGIDPASLNFTWDYRNVRVSGTLPETASEEQIALLLRETADGGIRHMLIDLDQPIAQITAPPPVTTDSLVVEPVAESPPIEVVAPEQLSVVVSSDGSVVNLNGAVLSEQQRERLVRSALSSQGVETVNDNLEIVGDPDTVTQLSDSKVAALENLLTHIGSSEVSFAEANLGPDGLNYRITANDKAGATRIENAASITLVDFSVTGEIDYLKTGEVDVVVAVSDARISLDGVVLSEEHSRRLRFAAEETFGAASVTDNLIIADMDARLPGADARVEQLAAAVADFSVVSRGKATLRADNLLLEGAVASDDHASIIRGHVMRARDNGLLATDDIVVTAVATTGDIVAFQRELTQLAAQLQGGVTFTTGNGQPSTEAKLVLDEVATSINRYPTFSVEVDGHTDNVGRDVVNEKLSQSRAIAVMDYLSGKSVDRKRLAAVGYGPRRPVADNDTPEGRAKNRRVEFTAVEKLNNN